MTEEGTRWPALSMMHFSLGHLAHMLGLRRPPAAKITTNQTYLERFEGAWWVATDANTVHVTSCFELDPLLRLMPASPQANPCPWPCRPSSCDYTIGFHSASGVRCVPSSSIRATILQDNVRATAGIVNGLPTCPLATVLACRVMGLWPRCCPVGRLAPQSRCSFWP